MNNPWPALMIGAALVIVGISLVISHRRAWRVQEGDPSLDDGERTYLYRRFRRRMQVSSILAVLGFLIGLGDLLLPLQRFPLWTTLYWIGVLLLTGWVILLAVGDLSSTAAHGRAQLARVRQRQRELERQIVEFKHRHLQNSGEDDFDAHRQTE